MDRLDTCLSPLEDIRESPLPRTGVLADIPVITSPLSAARGVLGPRLIMRTSDILLVVSALASSGLACGPKTAEATEVPAGSSQTGPEASCKHELGRCGGHKPGDGSCGGASAEASEAGAAAPTPTPLEDVVLLPGKFAEINLEMAAGSTTDVTFQAAGGPLEWNVHSHDGDKVAIHAEGSAADGKVRFAAPRAGFYSYLWKNSGSTPVRLTARLAAQGTVRVQSIHPPAALALTIGA